MAKGKLPLTNLPNWLLTLLFLIAVIGQNIFIILVVIFIGTIIYIQFSKPEKKRRKKRKKIVKENSVSSIEEEYYIDNTTRKVANKKKNLNNPVQIYNKEYSYKNFKVDTNGVMHGSLIILKTKYLKNEGFLKRILKVKEITGDLFLPKSANIFQSINKINGNVDLAYYSIDDGKIEHDQELDLGSLEKIGGNLKVYGKIKSFGKLQKIGRTLSLRNAIFNDFENINSIGKNLLLFHEDKKRFDDFPKVGGKIMSYKNRTNKIPLEQDKLFENPHLKSKKLGDPEKFDIWEQKLKRKVLAKEYEEGFKIFEKLKKSEHKYREGGFLYITTDILPFIFFQNKLNKNLLNARLLFTIYGNKYLTQIGIDNIQKIMPLIDKEIKNISLEKFDFINYNSLNKFYINHFKYLKIDSIYDDKEWIKLNKESMIFHKANNKYIEDLIIELEGKIFREVFREAENIYRESVGITRIGEGWISELLLFNRLKERFPNEEIIRHARLDWLGLQHLDIYLPKHNIGIEYQGLQHYKPIEFFGGEEAFKKNQERDARKKRLCEENECKLIYVDPDYEFKDVANSLIELI